MMRFIFDNQGFTDTSYPNLVCKLHKSLYGLKQMPRALFEKLHHVLLAVGFQSAKFDQFLFLKVIASLLNLSLCMLMIF